MAFTYKVKQGDTLNSIAQRYGFSDYKKAGIASVPSGNFDLIRPDEEITLGNYDPNKIQTFQQGSPVVSSKDNAQEFRDNSTKIDGVLAGIGGAMGIEDKTKAKPTDVKPTEQTPFATGEKNKEGTIETTGDPMRDKLNAWEKEQSAKFTAESAARKEEYANLYTTSLAAIDATANATIQRINTTFDKRLVEQERINKLNIDRVKAYGLSEGGRFTPIDFRDAITNREVEAGDKIAELDSQRNSLIAQAKSARDEGSSKLLREKLDDLGKVDEALRTKLNEVEKEAEDQYKLMRDIRKEEETKQAEAVKKMKERLTTIAPQYADKYGSMTPEEKDKFITKLVEQTGIDYATIYGTLEGAVTGASTKALDIKKKEADINASEALTKQRNASAAKSFADAAIVNTEKKTKSDMQKDIPDTFKNEAEFTTQRALYVKKYGLDGAKYWDAVFNKDDKGDYQYTDLSKTGGGKDDEETLAKNAKIGSVVTIGGQKFTKKGEDDFVLVK